MLESQMGGVQAQTRRVVSFEFLWDGVEIVAEDLAVEESHVSADLVEAAGLDRDADESDRGGGVGGCEDFVGGDGFLALARDDDFLDGCSPSVGVGNFDLFQASLNDALFGMGDSGGQGEVFLVDLASFEVAAELVVGVGGFGDHEQAGGFAIEAMEQSEIASLPEIVEQLGDEAVMKSEDAVEERVERVSFAGLGDGAGGLVDDEQVRVLVEDRDEDGRIRFDGKVRHCTLLEDAAKQNCNRKIAER